MAESFQRGVILYNQGRYALAADEFRRELATSSRSPAVLGMLGLSLLYGGQRALAADAIHEAARLGPSETSVHYALACLALRPASRDGGSRLTKVLDRLPYRVRRRTWAARAHARTALGIDPHDVNAWALLAACEFDLEEWPSAEKAARCGLTLEPGHERCGTLLARTLLATGRRGEADRLLADVLERDPQHAPAHLARAWARLDGGDAEGAVGHVTEALRLDPTHAPAQLALRQAKWSRAPLYGALLRGMRRAARTGGDGRLPAVARATIFAVAVAVTMAVRHGPAGPFCVVCLAAVALSITLAFLWVGRRRQARRPSSAWSPRCCRRFSGRNGTWSAWDARRSRWTACRPSATRRRA